MRLNIYFTSHLMELGMVSDIEINQMFLYVELYMWSLCLQDVAEYLNRFTLSYEKCLHASMQQISSISD